MQLSWMAEGICFNDWCAFRGGALYMLQGFNKKHDRGDWRRRGLSYGEDEQLETGGKDDYRDWHSVKETGNPGRRRIKRAATAKYPWKRAASVSRSTYWAPLVYTKRYG
ncbi:hypothetical protein AALO_G00197160 [Alosa alosa]|uniref:Uncharacterized protein n=1 Tax=Alosa alosa TaxID=278164 RepID=A0AAV6G1J1_9TELE|nr:hypothetical protein AALO_G00197160 [Alosa alosa]